jgi:CelD/BcsL family acetyltransferase involved in cellulose biosynthesis
MALWVQAYHGVDGFKALKGEWDDLLHRSLSDTIFLTLEFQRTWWKWLGRGDLLILAVRDGEALIGIAPLFAIDGPHGRRALSTVGCTEVADYLDFIIAQGHEEAVYSALVDYLAGPESPDWDVLDLCNVHQDSPMLQVLPPLTEARGWAASMTREDVCPVVQLPDTWEEYLQMLDKKQRHEIRRKLRRAEAYDGLSWYIVGPEHNLDAEADDFLDLMAASTPDKADFLTPDMRHFFRHLMRATHEAGWLQLAFLQVRGQKAAAYLNFVYDNRVLVYNSGLDWKTFPKLGAGIILTAYCIQQAIEEGREVFDFLQGDERYKYQFGGQDVEVRRLIVRKP